MSPTSAVSPVPAPAPAEILGLEIPFTPLVGVCELVIVRHGEQLQTRALAIGTDLDPPLSEMGRRQADAVGIRLATKQVDAVYTSPLLRAADTARAIGRHHGLEPEPLEDLMEFDLWTNLPPGMSRSDGVSDERRAEILAEFDRTRRIDAFPYAEDRFAFRARVTAAFDGIVANHLGHRVVAVCHSGVISAYLGSTLGVPDRDIIVRVHHTSLNVFRSDGERRAALIVNDHSHVEPFQDSVGEHWT